MAIPNQAFTNYPTPIDSAVSGILGDQSGYAVLASGTGAAPTTANYFQHGALYYRTDSGTGTPALYQNVGSIAVPAWQLLDTSGASLVLPTSATDGTSTTGDSLLITETTLTTGNGIRVLGTTGTFTTGGALFKADLSAAVAGNGFVGVTTGIYTGTGLLNLTANSMTSGQLLALNSSATAIATTGRMFLSSHTGATGTSATLNEFKTSANDETILLGMTAEALTTGSLLDFGATAALTTGTAIKVAHTTSAIADGGSLLRLSSSGVDTGGATNGTLLDVKSTGQLAGTIARFDNILTTGTGMSLIGTGVMTTTGNLLTLTANSATTAAGLLRINANGLTDGIGAIISSSATASTATGRLLKVDHTGATSTSGIIAEVASAATDETVIHQVTASAALAAGVASKVSIAAVTTGTGLAISNADALTTGKIADFTSNSADATARTLINVKNDNAAAVGTIPVTVTQDAPTSTNYFPIQKWNGFTLWAGNGTTPNGNLSGTTGDFLIGGDSGKAYICTATTTWAALS